MHSQSNYDSLWHRCQAPLQRALQHVAKVDKIVTLRKSIEHFKISTTNHYDTQRIQLQSLTTCLRFNTKQHQSTSRCLRLNSSSNSRKWDRGISLNSVVMIHKTLYTPRISRGANFDMFTTFTKCYNCVHLCNMSQRPSNSVVNCRNCFANTS
jgi:hypothetical protein